MTKPNTGQHSELTLSELKALLASEQAARLALEAKLTEQHQERQALLFQSEKLSSLGQLAAGMAHEINNPIGFVKSNLSTLGDYIADIQAYIALLKSSPEAAELSQFEKDNNIPDIIHDMDAIIQESDEGLIRVSDIVQSLKSFARVDESHQEWYRIEDCIESALKITQNQLKYSYAVSVELEQLSPIYGNQGQMGQVFVNLIMNATQAMPHGGAIMIDGKETDGVRTISVQDNGPGIPKAFIADIFNPFFTTKPVGEGTGLGLSIVHGIVEQHQGSIHVTSSPETGTCFTLQFPIQPMPA